MSLFATMDKPPVEKMSLREYQESALTAVEAGFQEYDRQLLVAPTGAGKTIMFAAAAQRNLPKRTLILAHREELLQQAVDKIWKSTGIEAALERADDRAPLSAPVVVGSVQTLMREKRLARWPADHFGLVVVDEAHHALSDSYQRVLEYFAAAKVLGVTATPDRGDKRCLGKYFQNIAYEINLLDLIKAGYLSRISIKTIPIKIDLRSVKTIAGDYSADDLDASIREHLDAVADALCEHASFRKTLCFLPLVRTSKAFVEICRKKGIAAEHIDGNDPDRDQKLKDFANNRFDLLANAMLLTEGYDCPDVDCVVCLRPTKVRALYSQMVGRGTRIAKGKQDLLLLDFLWMHEKHDLVKPAHLIAKTEKIAAKMTEIGDGDLEELQGRAVDEIEEEMEAASDAKAQREEAMRKAIAENANKPKKLIDAMTFFTSLHDVENADYEPTVAWEFEPVSDGQRAMLEKVGIDPDSITCRGHASKIIDRIISRRKMNLASAKQLALLKRLGHPEPESVSFKDASVWIDGKLQKGRAKWE